MDKQALRAEIRTKKRAMTPAQIEAASGWLAELLFAHPAYRAAKSLYGYLSYNQEVRTAKILQQAQTILLRDMPAVPLWYTNANGAWSKNVDNVKFDWKGQPVFYQITKK